MVMFSKKEWHDFGNFITKKSENVTAPINIEELCWEYKRESETSHSEGHLNFRVRQIRLMIWQWETHLTESEVLDNDTKVKMLFGLSAPVDYSFLAELKKDADVEVDKYLRITKYEKKGGGGLQLNGVHYSNPTLLPSSRCGKMLKMLAKFSQNRNSPMIDDDFLEEYTKSRSTTRTKSYLEFWYTYIKQYIHIATEYDMRTRIKMLFVAEAEVNTFFLEMLRKDAIVDVDEEGKITKYEARDGSLKLDKNQNSTEEGELSKTQVASEDKEDEKESTSKELSKKRAKTNGVRTRTAVTKPTTPVKKQDDVKVKTNSSVTRSGRVSKKIYPTADKDSDDQFHKNRRRSLRQLTKNKQSDAIVDDNLPTTSSNIATIGGNNSSAITSTPKIPVLISDSCSSSNNVDDIEFDAPTNEDNEVAAETIDSTKISKNRDDADAKKVIKSADSTPKIQKTSAKNPAVSAISKTENGGKSNIKKVTEPVKTTSTPKINHNKGSKTVQKEKKVVKITPKVYSEKRKLVSSASESTASKIAKKSAPKIPASLVFSSSNSCSSSKIDDDVEFEAIRDASLTPVTSSLPVENQRIEMTNSEDILKVLRSLVRSLDAPMIQLREGSKQNLQEFSEKIDKAIEKIRDKNHKVPSDDMSAFLNAGLHIVTRSATTQTTSSEDCASLQGLLWTLRSILINLSIPALDDFQKTIDENIRNLGAQENTVSIERIRRALEIVFASDTS